MVIGVTTVHHPRAEVPIAGVPWPAYKLVALGIGLVTLLLVGVVTASAAPAVLSAAAACALAWLVLGRLLPHGPSGDGRS